MANTPDSQRLMERTILLLDKVSVLPKGRLVQVQRVQLFDVLNSISSSVRNLLNGAAGECNNETQILEDKLVKLDTLVIETREDALEFLAGCLSVIKSVKIPEESPRMETSLASPLSQEEFMIVFSERPFHRAFADSILAKPNEIVSYDRMACAIGSKAEDGFISYKYLAHVAYEVSKSLSLYGDVVQIYGKGYRWEPKQS